jgi:hypothetical protein
MFLTYISKNFDDGQVSFETYCWSYLRSVFCFQNRLPICQSFYGFVRIVIFKRDAKVMKIISSPNFIEINFNIYSAIIAGIRCAVDPEDRDALP